MVCFRCIWPLSAVSRTAAGSSCLQVNINYCEKNTYRSGLGNQQFYNKQVFVRSAGFDIDTPDDFGRTCLHAAAAGG